MLIDHDASLASTIFGKKSGGMARGTEDMYDGLDSNGSPIVMQVELNANANTSISEGDNLGNEKDGKKVKSGSSNTKKKKKTK